MTQRAETTRFLLPPRVDGPIRYWTWSLGAAACVIYAYAIHGRGTLPNWSIPIVGFAVLYLGGSLGHLASLTLAELSSTTLKTWKWWGFGAEIADLTTATSVVVEEERKVFFAARYALKIAFSDRAEQRIGWWDPFVDRRGVKRRFEAIANQIGQSIAMRR